MERSTIPLLRRLPAGPGLVAALALLGATATAQPPRAVTPDGGRAIPVHRIPVYNSEGEKIAPDDDPLLPISLTKTCGQCHHLERIHQGWHFNDQDPKVPSGRPGEPWLLLDRRTGTTLPLSWRGWAGTARPDSVGLNRWLFTRAFGGHTPGGGAGAPAEPDPAKEPRWFVAGKLEINCLLCHSGHREQDGSEWAVQVSRQNLMWAATAAAGLGTVTGSTARLPDTWDPVMEAGSDGKGPQLQFDASRFRRDGTVFFDIRRHADVGRCYQCHSHRLTGPGTDARWRTNRDVHLDKGLHCASCHRHGEDHRMDRGVKGGYSCAGCHLEAGHLGAPKPLHKGLPPLHFSKITCTACHCGPYPEAKARLTQTARAHRMGVHGGYRGEGAAPHIYSPVYKRGEDGKIGVYRVVTPSYWGHRVPASRDGTDFNILPLSHFEVGRKANTILTPPPGKKQANPTLTPRRISQVLQRLSAADQDHFFVAGGKAWRRVGSGAEERIQSFAHPDAEPYAWPLAHATRPAAQSLGAKGCTECHSAGAPFHFGTVPLARPAGLGPAEEVPMHTLQDLDPGYLEALALSFEGRSAFKIVGFILAGGLLLLVLILTLHGVGGLLGWGRGRDV